MKTAVRGGEIADHRLPQRGRRVQILRVRGDAPYRDQAADHDAAIEEIREAGRIEFKRHGGGCGVPCRAGQKTGRGNRAVEVPRVLGSGVQIDESAGRVAGDFGRYRVVALQVGAVIAGYAAVRLLNAGA